MGKKVIIAAITMFLLIPFAVDAAERGPSDPAEATVQERLPLSRQLELKRTEYHTQLAELQAAFVVEYDAESALDLQRRITAHKLNYEISFHQIQLNHALKTGETERAEGIQATIDVLQEKLPQSDLPDIEEEGK